MRLTSRLLRQRRAGQATLTSAPLRIDALGLALLIRLATESDQPWQDLALRTPVEEDRVTVLLTPAAAEHPALQSSLPGLVAGLLSDCDLPYQVRPAIPPPLELLPATPVHSPLVPLLAEPLLAESLQAESLPAGVAGEGRYALSLRWENGGLRVDGQLATPNRVAARIRSDQRWRGRAVLIQVDGPPIPPAAANLLTTVVSKALDVAVSYGSESTPVEQELIALLGQTWTPPLTSSVLPELDPTWTEPEPQSQTDPDPLPTNPEPAVPPASSMSPAPPWLLLHLNGSADQSGLRRALAGEYDTHARFVVKTLAEQPGLRLGSTDAEVVAALTALRAYCLDHVGEIDATLRHPGDPLANRRAALIATWAARGLAACPSALGPVCRMVRVPEALTRAYQPGQVLVEPGFTTASLPGAGLPAGNLSYLIWSVSARRPGELGADPSSGRGTGLVACFAPGTRFEVLALVGADPGGTRQVYLRELPQGTLAGQSRGTARIVERLKNVEWATDPANAPAVTAQAVTAQGVTAPAVPGTALGLDDQGRPYQESSNGGRNP